MRLNILTALSRRPRPNRHLGRPTGRHFAAIAAAAMCLSAAGCTSAPQGPALATQTGDRPAVATVSSDASPIVAYVDGQPLRRDAMWPALTETAGDLVFDEFILDAALRRRLAQRNLTVTEAQIAAERTMLSEALADDPDVATRLLVQLRERRGLGDDRFDRLLRRNAALRLLVADDAQLPAEQLDAQARRAFAQQYGPAFRVRLLTADTPAQAQALRQRILAGEAFADVAAEHSTDPSRAQGGLLSPINPLDPTYPQVLRDALPRLDPDVDAGLSPILALDGGYAFVQLLQSIPAQAVTYEQQADRLRAAVQQGNQRLLMEQLADALRDEADVLVTDRELGKAWKK